MGSEGDQSKFSEAAMDGHTSAPAAEINAIRAAYAALNGNDMPALARILDAEIERIESLEFAGGGTYRGVVAVMAHVAHHRGKWAEGTCEPERFIPVNGRIVVVVQVRVRLMDEIEWREGRTADVWKFRSGRAIEFRTFADTERAMEWAGAGHPDGN